MCFGKDTLGQDTCTILLPISYTTTYHILMGMVDIAKPDTTSLASMASTKTLSSFKLTKTYANGRYNEYLTIGY